MNRRRLLALLVAVAAGSGPLAAQVPSDLARERSDFATWLRTAGVSPLRALTQQAIGPGLTVGPPGSDIPLEGVGATQLLQDRSGPVVLVGGGNRRPVPGNRAVALGDYQLVVAGLPGRQVATFYGRTPKSVKLPTHFDYRPAWRQIVTLDPVTVPSAVPLLGSDGVEAQATEAGRVQVTVGAQTVRLRVFRFPTGAEESELEIYFRDGTNGSGSYPAGRFVSLVPTGDGRYVLDFNRARNPFCAYSTVYPCPAPWRGNTVPAAVDAGERYAGGGQSAPPI
ncbi:MAG: DUF1684 domain-containing protein [Gemmatimonadota bacterium]